ncbi:laminin subunit beta-1 isoform X2 [Sitophilus oryzae]|uniref:Laminin subunit beta-1 isoform X2 n=1 Tax=Sitophilus oryzae TaxID=7048 RepID=A0A6J2XB58_SITOR|nr:laminin subunit beta-1 isoform X2 [Sitophilus oryzae]
MFTLRTLTPLILIICQNVLVNSQFIPYNKPRVRTYPVKGYEPKKLHPCEHSSCYPATGNLLIGRENQLYASSTCGLYRQEKYCIVSHLDEERKKCFWCDSTPTLKPSPQHNHNISNIVYRMYPGTRKISWWQSENGKENVYIQLDLEAEFHFTHLIITFKTFRPAAMLIERSYDFKQTWQVYRYFAHNCTESFPNIRTGSPRNLTDIVCESRYSGLSPATEGEVIYRVLPPNMLIENPYSEQVQNLLKMTNLRINFTKLHTLGDDLLDKRDEIQEKYYYAITDMVVRGSCSCYGHANRCLPLPNIDPKPDMVHGRCECTHNTKGRNCEKCEDFFNDLPWRPAIGKQTNACKKCNCNNHATSCHFDAALYEAKGNISGGVCDGCLHNTMGSNCEQCKPFFFRDPNRSIKDPEVCVACDCDPRGSLDEGICDSITDPVNNLVAGSCHCKTNVDGRRCDQCKNGYWNFTSANPDGCQPCTCNILGTIDNQGCNVETGECTCKRYVTGRDCLQCLPQYWGLSDKQDGCQPCDCDPGGSYDNFCDVITGNCRCREHMSGRTCNLPNNQYFVASLDFLLFEAEVSKTDGQVVIRAPYKDGRETTWTGTGFVKLYEGNFIEVYVNEISTSMDYDIIINYEPTSPETIEDIVVKVIRPDDVDPLGECANINYDDDIKHTNLPSNQRQQIVYPPVCLEARKPYTIRIEFTSYNYPSPRPTASVLIDSIWLKPRLDSIKFFTGSVAASNRKDEFERYNCGHPSMFYKGAEIPAVCKKYHSSIAAYVFDGAKDCDCDPTGSTSKICDPYGGNCTCKPNVAGRKCDKCAPITYDFGPTGCKVCECDSIGALDNFCNITTGQCKCRPNTYGRECNQCRIGFWNFPNCERCNCNGHADTCEAHTGVCINCRDNTTGAHCDNCVEGYYGDPRLGVDIPCRQCPCPGPVGSNHSFADRCSLDPVTKDVTCECQVGYAGTRCDVCADNYYGNPEVPGGSCQPCDCNDNIDLLRPGNCDPHTGKCLNCLYDTTGDHCEVCRPGFFRYTLDGICEPCICNALGTNRTAEECNPLGGQCSCYPNVSGLRCDECIADHWKIASGSGCEPCDCDPNGSYRSQCNKFDGQCECRDGGFGGRQCNECLPGFYGDPKVQCLPCECHILGSSRQNCNMRTGACECRPGVGGHNCDVCKKGYIGNVPDCVPCGECFDNWDRIIQESKNQTLVIIERASDIKKVGATGAYTKEFDVMQGQLDEIDHLLNSTGEIDVDAIEEELQILRNQINETENDKLNKLDNNLANIKKNIILTSRKVNTLNESMADLQDRIRELEGNGTKLLEANVKGALNLIEKAKEKADLAAHKAEHSREDVKYAENQCRATETFINSTRDKYKTQSEENEDELRNISTKLEQLNQEIPNLNYLVCDGHGDPCDSICGGAGCGNCGNFISCENGAKQLAETAIDLAKKTEGTLKNIETLANNLIRNVSIINTNETRTLAQKTYDTISTELNRTNTSLERANQMIKEMREYMVLNGTKPEDIKKLAEEVLKKNVHKTPEEVKKLADDIKNAVDRLRHTEDIISATRNDLRKVNELKENAKYAKSNATKLLTDAEAVNQSLNKTQDAQREAENTINKAGEDYNEVENILDKIDKKTKDADGVTSAIRSQINEIKGNLTELQTNITENENYADRVIQESKNILSKAKNTTTASKELQTKYEDARERLDKNLDKVKNTKERSTDLFNKAVNLVDKVTKTQEDINKLEMSNHGTELNKLEMELQDLIAKMGRYTKTLENKVKYYKTCT